ncbi:MAG: HIG1 domain-containing protein [Burkholderiales bacterium]|nr:HIG1 domain-containing protein [Burkholderiales bacterium]
MSLMTILVLIAALCAAMSLFQGVTSMAHGGAEDQGKSHLLMLKRVGWQGLAFLLLLFALLSNIG